MNTKDDILNLTSMMIIIDWAFPAFAIRRDEFEK